MDPCSDDSLVTIRQNLSLQSLSYEIDSGPVLLSTIELFAYSIVDPDGVEIANNACGVLSFEGTYEGSAISPSDPISFTFGESLEFTGDSSDSSLIGETKNYGLSVNLQSYVTRTATQFDGTIDFTLADPCATPVSFTASTGVNAIANLYDG